MKALLMGNSVLLVVLLLVLSESYSFVSLNSINKGSLNSKASGPLSATVPLSQTTDFVNTVYTATALKDRALEPIEKKSKLEISSTIDQGNDLNLPLLTPYDQKMLKSGQRIQKQERSGREGTGWVVLDVAADHRTILRSLADFDRYEEMIPTVRRANVYERLGGTVTKVQYSLSRFRIKVNIVNEIVPEQNLIRFSLDEERSSRGSNLVIKKADGFWHVHPCEDRPGYSRVWLNAAVIISPLVPTTFVDYAACRALPRATKWIQPHFHNLMKAVH